MKIINSVITPITTNKVPDKQQNESNIPVQSNTEILNVKKPDLQNLKANFCVSFGANNVTYPRQTSSASRVTSVSDEKSIDVPFYNSTADNLAVVMSPDNHAVVSYEDKGVMPEFLVEKFAANIKEGKYKRSGFDPEKTKVFYLDGINKIAEGASLQEKVTKVFEALDATSKAVVFVPDFTNFANDLPEGYLNNLPRTGRVQLVGLTDNNNYEKNKGFERIKPLFERVKLRSPGEKETKQILKDQKFIIDKMTKKYQPVKIEISEKALNELVDKSAKQVSGDFPGKALHVLRYIINAKAQQSKDKKDTTPVMITSLTVKKFFETNDAVLEELKSKTGTFKQAEIPKLSLSDVGGAPEVKENIRDGILTYLKDPAAYLAKGQKAPKGVLFYGPPGTGKTLMAKAIAGEAQVPYFSVTGSEFVEKYVGVGAQRVRELFTNARNAAMESDQKAAIVFIDEIDAIGKKRGNGDNGGAQESEATLNQILTEMDGFNNNSKCSVIVIAATNRKDILDPALIRKGRFDDTLEIPNPANNKEGRLEILNIHARGKVFKNEQEKAKILKEASAFTAGLSGADLADLMNKSTKLVLKRMTEHPETENKFITNDDMVNAYLWLKAGPVKISDENLEEQVSTVAHECGHALVAQTINDLAQKPWKKVSDISFITLEQRGDFLGAVFYKPGDNEQNPNFDSVIASTARGYAGGMSERLYREGRSGAGVSSDLENATGLIENAITKWGLGPNTGFVSLSEKSDLKKIYEPEIKSDIKLMTKTSERVANLIIDFNKDFIGEYVDAYKANSGNGGNNLSGEGFKTLHDEWLTKSGKDKEAPLLQKKIDILMDSARKNKVISDEELEKQAQAK